MNVLQLSKQFKYLLKARTWPGAGGETIFGSVLVTDMIPKDTYPFLRMPVCAIKVEDDEPNPQTPGRLKQMFTFTLLADAKGDKWGEMGLIGGPRVNGNLSSKGRGVLELDEELRTTLRQIQETSGIKIIARPSSALGTASVDGLGVISAREIKIAAECTDQRYYHPPIRVAASVAGPNVTLTWVDPPDRFDRLSLRIRRIAGSSPPGDVTLGTQISDVAIGVQTAANAPGAGTWTYAVFGAYTDSGIAQSERYSDVEDGTYATVTV